VDFSRYTYTSSRMRVIHAILGVTIFLLLNGLLLGLFMTSEWFSRASGTLILGSAALLVNISVLLYFGFTRYWLTIGPLALFAFLSSGVLLFSSACFPAPPTPVPTWSPLPTIAPQSPLEPPGTPTAPMTQTVPFTATVSITESGTITSGQFLSTTPQSD
jgi:hypothetical protein